jgi:adenosylmethionine-8-amino-7-oxononanoate aminotransferase
MFGSDHAGISADIMCLGKALTGGTMTLAATLVSKDICAVIAKTSPGVLMHGPTFMANPLACAAARANLDLLETTPWRARVAKIQSQLRTELEACRDLPGVADVRALGAIGVVELEQPVDMARVQPAFVERGVWIRPFGRLVYTMPPFVTSPEDVTALTDAVYSVIAEVHGDRSGGSPGR